MTIQLKADTTRMWELATRATYLSKDYGSLAIREMLQNSIDAINKAIREGQIEEGLIDIRCEDGLIEFSDNGVGMSDEDLTNKFLTLGGTTKQDDSDTSSIGGYGLAKAVILGCASDWTIRTRSYELPSTLLGKVEEIPTTEFMQGTTITLSGVENAQYQLKKALFYLESSEIPNNINVQVDGEDITPMFIGSGSKVTIEEEDLEELEGTSVEAHLYETESSNPHMYVRLNGLTQYKNWLWGTGVTHDLVIDITTINKPGSFEYPFDLSREALRGQASRLISSIKHEVESDTHNFRSEWQIQLFEDQSLVKDMIEESTVSSYGGYYGFMDEVSTIRSNYSLSSSNYETEEDDDDPTTAEDKKEDESVRTRASSLVRNWAMKVNTNLEIDNSKIIELYDYKLMIVWDTVIGMISQNSEVYRKVYQYYPGLIIDSKMNSDKITEDDKDYILVNPMLIKDAPDNKSAAIILINQACHIIAHIKDNDFTYHGNSFVGDHEELLAKASGLFEDVLSVVEKLNR